MYKTMYLTIMKSKISDKISYNIYRGSRGICAGDFMVYADKNCKSIEEAIEYAKLIADSDLGKYGTNCYEILLGSEGNKSIYKKYKTNI